MKAPLLSWGMCAAHHSDLVQSSLQPLPREIAGAGFNNFPLVSIPVQRNSRHTKELSHSAVSGVYCLRNSGHCFLHPTRVPHACHEGPVLSFAKSEGAAVPSLQSAVSLQAGAVRAGLQAGVPLPFAFQPCMPLVMKTANQGATSLGSLVLHPRKHPNLGWMSRTGHTTFQLLLSKAKVCGVKRFLVASVPIPVTHTENLPMAGCLRCCRGQSCHSNAADEALYPRLGRASGGRKAWAEGGLKN